MSVPELPQQPQLERGATFEYRLRDLDVGTAVKLAEVIVHCQGKGSHPLRVIGPDGLPVLWEGATIMVSPIEFKTAASIHGI